jgi:Domain of unknown function (DUF5668)
MDPRQRSQVTTGLLLIGLGLLFLFQRLSLLPHLEFHRLWPLFLLVVGVAKLFAPGEDGRRGGAAWLIFIGLLFLLHTYDVFRLSESWPLFIVAGGVSMLFGRSPVKAGAVEPRQGGRAESAPGAAPIAQPADGDSHGH